KIVAQYILMRWRPVTSGNAIIWRMRAWPRQGMTNPSNRKMSQKSQGMRDETTRASVSATQGATCIGRPFMAASSIMPVHFEGGPHGRSREAHVDGQGRGLSSQAESRD